MAIRVPTMLVEVDTATKADDIKGSAAAAAAANEASTETVSPAMQGSDAQGSAPSVMPVA